MRRFLVIFALSFLFLPASLCAETGKYIFEHFPAPFHWINGIFHDKDGFMWISTRNGLYKYVGRGADDVVTVLEGDQYYELYQDEDGFIWAKRRNGFIIYDPKTRSVKNEVETASVLGSDVWIDYFVIDSTGNFWWNEESAIYVKHYKSDEKIYVGTASGHVNDIFCMNDVTYVLTSEGTVHRFVLDVEKGIRTLPEIVILEENADSENAFNALFVDSSENIWISQSSQGVWMFPKGKSVPVHLTSSSSENAIRQGYISAMTEDHEGNVWLASDHGGISICSKNGRVLENLRNNPSDDNTISSNGIYALCRDDDGNMWVGYTKKGLSAYRGENKAWSLTHIKYLKQKNLNDDINTTCEDVEGNIWLGTDGYGLVCIDKDTSRETVYTVENSGLRSNVITSIHCDDQGRIWIGTFYGGLSCLENGVMKTYSYDEHKDGLASDNVWAIDDDEQGRIWIATLGGGVQMMDPETGELRTFNSDENGMSNDVVHDIVCAEDGNVYAATAYGLSVIDIEDFSVTVSEPEDLLQNNLTGIHVDSKGLVWLDEDGILQIYDPAFDTFYTPDETSLKSVRGIIESDDDSVWVITDDGICKVDVYRSVQGYYTFDISSFHFSQHLDLHFNQRSVSKTRSGDFIIGSFCGYVRFRPDMFSESGADSMKELHFVDLYVGNQKIEPCREYDGKVILDNALEYVPGFTIRHDMSIISVEFSSLDYLSVKDRVLYYRMTGLSDEWITTDKNSRRISFTNLTPGKYTLCLTPDNDAPEKGISLSVRVLPPWWASVPALVAYVLAFVGAIWISFVYVIRKRRVREKNMEKTIRQERRHYLDEMKMQFFTNVSHDFRTPLTLILTPIEEMFSKDPEKKKDIFLTTIHRNAQRLLNLVNEVLDLRNMEMYGNELHLSKGDLVSVINDTVSSFRLMAESQGVDLKTSSEQEQLIFDFDAGKVVKILTNLLSNAFKFTSAGGMISVDINKEESYVRVDVKDTGSGVPDKYKRRIFDRFYQAKGSPTGSGIGLHVVREFILLHGGEIHVRDNEPAGAVFSFTLPLRCSVHVAGEDNAEVRNDDQSVSPVKGRSTILIVDDNEDFRTFMCSSLRSEYNILDASNGSEALKVVTSNDIDVIVSDVMMPIMDGTELCRRIKTDINTSHIPVILLTAKTMPDDEFTGLESGADDYLTKPFNMSILRLRIAKFIEWKKRAKRLFEQELEITTEQITLTSIDDKLLQQAINIINDNISNPDFSVVELSTALCMHRTSLYKKLVYLTGKTPVEFIRAIRLKRAAALLETEGVYVSEVAYMVGFNSPKVFAGHFKEEFGCSPSEYRKNKV